LPQGTASFRSDDLIRVAGRRLHSATLDQLACGGQSLEQQNIANRNESVPTQLAQCWFLELAISSAIMLTHFSNIRPCVGRESANSCVAEFAECRP